MKVKGSYVFKVGNKVFRKDNLITLFGESFFLNRMINNAFSPVEYILIGNSSQTPSISDMRLGNETVKKKCFKSVDLDRKEIVLTCNCEVREIENSSEIGVSNGNILISHDVYELPEGFITPGVDTVEVRYTFRLGD